MAGFLRALANVFTGGTSAAAERVDDIESSVEEDELARLRRAQEDEAERRAEQRREVRAVSEDAMDLEAPPAPAAPDPAPISMATVAATEVEQGDPVDRETFYALSAAWRRRTIERWAEAVLRPLPGVGGGGDPRAVHPTLVELLGRAMVLDLDLFLYVTRRAARGTRKARRMSAGGVEFPVIEDEPAPLPQPLLTYYDGVDAAALQLLIGQVSCGVPWKHVDAMALALAHCLQRAGMTAAISKAPSTGWAYDERCEKHARRIARELGPTYLASLARYLFDALERLRAPAWQPPPGELGLLLDTMRYRLRDEFLVELWTAAVEGGADADAVRARYLGLRAPRAGGPPVPSRKPEDLDEADWQPRVPTSLEMYAVVNRHRAFAARLREHHATLAATVRALPFQECAMRWIYMRETLFTPCLPYEYRVDVDPAEEEEEAVPAAPATSSRVLVTRVRDRKTAQTWLEMRHAAPDIRASYAATHATDVAAAWSARDAEAAERRVDEAPADLVRGGILAMQTGMGKTGTMLMAACLVDRQLAGLPWAPPSVPVERLGGTLIVAAGPLIGQWLAAAEVKFAPGRRCLRLTAALLAKDPALERVVRQRRLGDYDFVLVTPFFLGLAVAASDLPAAPGTLVRPRAELKATALSQTVAALLKSMYWRRVVVDEAHELVRSPDTNVTVGVDCLEARAKWLLTATPYNSRMGDLYNEVNLVLHTAPHWAAAAGHFMNNRFDLFSRRVADLRRPEAVGNGRLLTEVADEETGEAAEAPADDPRRLACLRQLPQVPVKGDRDAPRRDIYALFALQHIFRSAYGELTHEIEQAQRFDVAPFDLRPAESDLLAVLTVYCQRAMAGLDKKDAGALGLVITAINVARQASVGAFALNAAMEEHLRVSFYAYRKHIGRRAGSPHARDDAAAFGRFRDWIWAPPETRATAVAASSRAQRFRELLRALRERREKKGVVYPPDTPDAAKQHTDKMIVFSDYQAGAEAAHAMAAAEFGAAACSLIMGGRGDAQREREFARFASGAGVVLVMTYAVGSTGLDLNFANHVVLYDGQWVESRRQQAIARVARIGQRKAMFFTDLIANVWVDQSMLRRRGARVGEWAAFIGDGPPSMTSAQPAAARQRRPALVEDMVLPAAGDLALVVLDGDEAVAEDEEEEDEAPRRGKATKKTLEQRAKEAAEKKVASAVRDAGGEDAAKAAMLEIADSANKAELGPMRIDWDDPTLNVADLWRL